MCGASLSTPQRPIPRRDNAMNLNPKGATSWRFTSPLIRPQDGKKSLKFMALSLRGIDRSHAHYLRNFAGKEYPEPEHTREKSMVRLLRAGTTGGGTCSCCPVIRIFPIGVRCSCTIDFHNTFRLKLLQFPILVGVENPGW